MINKDGKLFGKISIIDLLVIVVIVAMAAGVYMRFFKTPEKVEVKTEKLTYTMKVTDARMFSVEALEKKGDIYDADTKEKLGTITDVKIDTVKMTNLTEKGKAVEVEYPERYTAILTVEVDGNVNANGYYTQSNEPISVGSVKYFETKYVATAGVIMDIEG